MKNLLILLFIPLFGVSQVSYKDVMSINSEDTFKKVVIENGYEFDSVDEEGWISYGFNIVRDSIEGNKSSKWGIYNQNDGKFTFQFNRRTLLGEFFGTEDDTSENPYDKIIKDIKKNCKYYKIINYNGIDDDKNGYVDDIHGWNFLGDSEGDQYQLIRMLKSGEDFPEKEEALKQYADKIKSEVDDDIETIISNLKTNVYHYEENIKKSLRLSWNARTTGDNPDDFSQRFYGDSDVRPKHDDESHGTHVAGIVAANRNNTLGMKGVADKVAIMVLRAVPNKGDEYDKDIALSIRYAADNGADIVNMSFGKGFSPHSDKVREAIVYAESKGVLLVNAAGNDGENIDVVPTYPNDSVDNGPEVANNVITVGAIGPSLSSRMVAPFSNYGLNNVDIFAPGAIIYSTTPSNNYNSYSGTSMAAPAVSGVAALVKSYFPKLSPNAVKKVIIESGLPITMEVRVGASGMETQLNKVSRTGKIANAYNALLYASTHFKMLKKLK